MVNPNTLKINSSDMTWFTTINNNYGLFLDSDIAVDKKEEKTLKMKEELCLCSRSIWN
jgi:hypothetical protein